jgi:hypothetical protein
MWWEMMKNLEERVNRIRYWLSIEERRRDGKQHLGICWE